MCLLAHSEDATAADAGAQEDVTWPAVACCVRAVIIMDDMAGRGRLPDGDSKLPKSCSFQGSLSGVKASNSRTASTAASMN